VLHGKILFALLLLSLLSEDRLGQRGMADLYASPHFRAMFNLASKRGKLSHSSLSERLSKVDVTYFKKSIPPSWPMRRTAWKKA
jgi:hypothetical protein